MQVFITLGWWLHTGPMSAINCVGLLSGTDPGVSRVSGHPPLWYGALFWKEHIFKTGAYSSDFGLLEEQSSPKWEIPCPGRPWTIVQNLTPLALSRAEKSVPYKVTNLQTNKQTVIDISTLCLSACVEMTTNDRSWTKNSVGQHQLRTLSQMDPYISQGFLKNYPTESCKPLCLNRPIV